MWKITILLFIILIVSVSATVKIGVTSDTFTGDLGGLSGADAKCRAEFGSTAKALVGGENRRAPNAFNSGKGWVLPPNSQIRRISDGVVIGTTNEFGCMSSLVAPIDPSGPNVRTGLDPDCDSLDSSFFNCEGLFSSDGEDDSSIGDSNAINIDWINSDFDSCEILLPIYCFVTPSQLSQPSEAAGVIVYALPVNPPVIVSQPTYVQPSSPTGYATLEVESEVNSLPFIALIVLIGTVFVLYNVRKRV